MQGIADLWHRFTGWVSSVDLSSVNANELASSFLSALQGLSQWLNTGYRGLTIALVLLVIIVNRILKRQHD